MGADATLFLFDYRRYRDEVVPALLELLRTGRPRPWLAKLLDPPGDLLPYLRAQPTDIARHCTYLTRDLGYQGDQSRRGHGVETYSPCPSRTCPDRGNCPLHETRGHGKNEPSLVLELLNMVYEDAVTTRCLGASRFVGRSLYALDFLPLLDRLAVAARDPVRDLLAALELRGRVLGYQLAGSEGIHGWLAPEETALLATRLDQLSLGGSTEEAMLSVVRDMAGRAAAAGRGLLWGNDIVQGVRYVQDRGRSGS
jgi:hypothetical protein